MPYWASSCSSRWLKASHGQMTVMSAGQGGSRLRVPRPPVPPGPLGPVVHTPVMRVQGPLGVEPSSQDTPPLGFFSFFPFIIYINYISFSSFIYKINRPYFTIFYTR